jgi:predicted nuclease of predicted toxin-antitoxin system
MSLRLYLDDCAADRRLVTLLRSAGHDVTIPADTGLTGAKDEVHFAHSLDSDRLLLTRNPKDFTPLLAQRPDHPGVLAIYFDNDPTRDMTAAEVVRAIENLLTAGVVLTGGLHPLNQWRY